MLDLESVIRTTALTSHLVGVTGLAINTMYVTYQGIKAKNCNLSLPKDFIERAFVRRSLYIFVGTHVLPAAYLFL